MGFFLLLYNLCVLFAESEKSIEYNKYLYLDCHVHWLKEQYWLLWLCSRFWIWVACHTTLSVSSTHTHTHTRLRTSRSLACSLQNSWPWYVSLCWGEISKSLAYGQWLAGTGDKAEAFEIIGLWVSWGVVHAVARPVAEFAHLDPGLRRIGFPNWFLGMDMW